MKKKLVLASKIVMGIFCVLLLAICMVLAYNAEGTEVDLSAFIAIPFMISTVVMIVLLVIECCMEIWARWKERKIRDIIRIPVEGILIVLVVLAYDLLISKEVGSVRRYAECGIIWMVLSMVMSFWKRVEKEKVI